MADLSYHNQMKRIQLLEIYISSGLSIKDAWGPISDFQLFDDAPNCCVRFFGFFYSLSILQSRWVLRFVPRLHIIPMTPLKPQSLTRGSDCSCVCMAPRQRPGNPKSKIKIICALLKHTLHPKPYPLLNNNIQSELWETSRTAQNVSAQTVSRPHNPILGRLWLVMVMMNVAKCDYPCEGAVAAQCRRARCRVSLRSVTIMHHLWSSSSSSLSSSSSSLR